MSRITFPNLPSAFPFGPPRETLGDDISSMLSAASKARQNAMEDDAMARISKARSPEEVRSVVGDLRQERKRSRITDLLLGVPRMSQAERGARGSMFAGLGLGQTEMERRGDRARVEGLEQELGERKATRGFRTRQRQQQITRGDQQITQGSQQIATGKRVEDEAVSSADARARTVEARATHAEKQAALYGKPPERSEAQKAKDKVLLDQAKTQLKMLNESFATMQEAKAWLATQSQEVQDSVRLHQAGGQPRLSLAEQQWKALSPDGQQIRLNALMGTPRHRTVLVKDAKGNERLERQVHIKGTRYAHIQTAIINVSKRKDLPVEIKKDLSELFRRLSQQLKNGVISHEQMELDMMEQWDELAELGYVPK